VTGQPRRDEAPPAAPGDAGLEAAEYEDYEEFDEYEDGLEEPSPERRRAFPLGTLLAIAAGVWVGRAFYRLPDGLENLAGLLLALLTALLAAGLYRRWVRRQMAAARARRAGPPSRSTPAG
jgi:hypothetical protein